MKVEHICTNWNSTDKVTYIICGTQWEIEMWGHLFSPEEKKVLLTVLKHKSVFLSSVFSIRIHHVSYLLLNVILSRKKHEI